MKDCGPFENTPHLAVAVSGGADSMALVLLANRWASRRGGRISALTVDHGLRPTSGEEISAVRSWMTHHAIDHFVLPWQGKKPSSGIQNAARKARYGLLLDWCRKANVLHLLVGHHRQDQIETVEIRLCGDSGIRGLAGITPVVATPAVRILRPLLTSRPAQIRAFLNGRQQPWLDDPSNTDVRYARGRLRASQEVLRAVGMDAVDVLEFSTRMKSARTALDLASTRILAASCSADPLGYACIDSQAVAHLPPPFALDVLSLLVTCIAGRSYPPNRKKLERVLNWMAAGGGGTSLTLARCLIMRWNGRILVCRELRNLPAAIPFPTEQQLVWDGRFAVSSDAIPAPMARRLTIWPLAACCNYLPTLSKWLSRRNTSYLPRAVVLSLPAVVDPTGIAAVPPLGYWRDDFSSLGRRGVNIWFQPYRPLSL